MLVGPPFGPDLKARLREHDFDCWARPRPRIDDAGTGRHRGSGMTGSIGLSPNATVALRSRPGRALIATTTLASMVGFLDANVVNVAVPSIGRNLHAGVSALQWTVTGYLVTAAALLLLSGALADRFGRKRILVTGLWIMLVAGVWCASSPAIGWLVAGRIVQGVGAALVVPSSLALLNGTLRADDRARGIGVWAGLATLGTTAFPYLGGWLVDHASWRYVFVLALPLILLAFLGLHAIPDITPPTPGFSLDLSGATLAVIGLGGVIYAATAGGTSGWLTAKVLVTGGIGVLALGALAPIERRIEAPMLRLSLFRSRQFDAINVATLIFYGALGAASYLLVLQCELRLGYSASAAGAVLIPESVVFLSLAPVSGALVARIGARWLMVAGMSTAAIAFALLSGLHRGNAYAVAILPGTLLWGLGLGLLVTPLTAAVLAAVSDDDLGEATAVNDAAARVGAVVVIALVPALVGATGGRTLGEALGTGYRGAMVLLAIASALTAAIVARFVTDSPAAANGQ